MNEQKRYTPSISLKEDQRDWIKKQAEKHGISYTHYMRKVVLGVLPQSEEPFYNEDKLVPVRSEMSRRDLKQIFHSKMPKVTNNLNQIARRLNSGQPVDDKMLEMMDDLKESHQKIALKIMQVLR